MPKDDNKLFLYYTLFLSLSSGGFGHATLRVLTRQGQTKDENLDDGGTKPLFDLTYQSSEVEHADDFRSEIQPRVRGSFGYWYGEQIMLPSDLEIAQFATTAPRIATVLAKMEKAATTYNLGYKYAVPHHWNPDPLPVRMEALDLIGATAIHNGYDHRWYTVPACTGLAAEARSVSHANYN